MMRIILGLALAVFFSFGAMAAPHGPPQELACRGSWSEGQAYFASHGGRVVELTADQRQALQADYNATEPATDYVLGHAYTVEPPGAPEGIVVIVLVVGDDCVIEAGAMPKERMLSIISRHSS